MENKIHNTYLQLVEEVKNIEYNFGSYEWMDSISHLKAVRANIVIPKLIWELYGHFDRQSVKIANDLLELLGFEGNVKREGRKLLDIIDYVLLNMESYTGEDILDTLLSPKHKELTQEVFDRYYIKDNNLEDEYDIDLSKIKF